MAEQLLFNVAACSTRSLISPLFLSLLWDYYKASAWITSSPHPSFLLSTCSSPLSCLYTSHFRPIQTLLSHFTYKPGTVLHNTVIEGSKNMTYFSKLLDMVTRCLTYRPSHNGFNCHWEKQKTQFKPPPQYFITIFLLKDLINYCWTFITLPQYMV